MVGSEPMFKLSYEAPSHYGSDYSVKGYFDEGVVKVEMLNSDIAEEFEKVEERNRECLDVDSDEIARTAEKLVDQLTWGMNVSASDDESLEELSVEVRLDEEHYELFQEGRQDPFLGRRHEIDFVKEVMENYIERAGLI
jgi:hypothetical protein